MAATTTTVERTSEPPRLRVFARIRELSSYREILVNLVRKELKVKYTASVLGAVWSLLNPVVFLAVFTFVSIVTHNQIANYPVYLLSGLLAWNMFSVAISVAARSVIDNSNLVKKVYFPREILPLSAIGVALVDYALQSGVLLAFMLVTGYGFHPVNLLLFPLAFLTLLAFTTAVSFWLSAMNVRYRDIQHLLNLGLIVWFWMTPVVYATWLVQSTQKEILGVNMFVVYLLNPLAPIVEGMHRALYSVVTPPGSEHAVLAAVSLRWIAGVLSIVLAASIGLLFLTWRTFFRLSGDFAEEL